MAWTWSSKQVDPIAYRAEEQQSDSPVTEQSTNWQFDPAKLQNADVNISAYGDDSSEKNYNNPDLWGWENTKYKGENTKNTSVEYNPNATIEWLNPDYAYWQKAQMINSWEAGYIQRRNDEIASALYNAGKTSIQDVADFLNKQTWFQNSTENERKNTIASVWKRLWEIQWNNSSNGSQNGNKNNNNNWADNNSAVKNMEADLLKSNEWTIYWKNTADTNWEDSAIRTLNDAYSVEQAVNRQRVNNLKSLQWLDSRDIATSIANWYTPYWEQGMRDLMQYDPAKYAEVQNAIKQINWQKNINSITKDGSVDYSSQTTAVSDSINSDITDFAFSNANNPSEALSVISSSKDALSRNDVANSASEQMSTIEWNIARLQTRLKNLDREAKSAFKSDVPQYIVNAYKANKQLEIKDQLDTLTSQYNMAASRYQNEWNNIKWQAEYNLKQQQLDMQKQEMALNDYYKKQWLALDWASLNMKYSNTTSTTVNWKEVQTSNVSREQIGVSVDELVQWCVDGTLWKAQCAAWIQQYYLPSLWVNLWTLSKYSQKQWICNEKAWEYMPQKWDIVVMSSPTKPENWHMGIVTWIDEATWTITYLDWNWSIWEDGKWTETAQVRTTQINNSKIYWYYNPTKQNIDSNYYDPSYSDIYWKYLQGKFAAGKQLETQAAAMWKTVQELDAEARAWNNAKNTDESAMNILSSLEDLLTQDPRFSRKNINLAPDLTSYLSSSSADYLATYNFIKDNVTFDKLLDLKNNWATFWALSDNELRAIGNAASKLNLNMSKEKFQQEVISIYNRLSAWMWEDPVSSVDEILGRKWTHEINSAEPKGWNTNIQAWKTAWAGTRTANDLYN